MPSFPCCRERDALCLATGSMKRSWIDPGSAAPADTVLKALGADRGSELLAGTKAALQPRNVIVGLERPDRCGGLDSWGREKCYRGPGMAG